MAESAQDVVAFWLSPQVKPLWFNSTAEFDTQLRQQYEALYRRAAGMHLANWEESALGALALVILLDQFPLNMYRGKAESFAGEAAARAIAQRATEHGLDQQLNGEQKSFLYMPYMHSESIADQERAISLYQEAELHDDLQHARHHRDIVLRFGRFPHRNAILGRESTEAELAYLDSAEGFHG